MPLLDTPCSSFGRPSSPRPTTSILSSFTFSCECVLESHVFAPPICYSFFNYQSTDQISIFMMHLQVSDKYAMQERVSPSYLLNGGWSLGPPLTGGQSSSNGSSRTSSQVSSPSSVPSCDFQDAWDTLDAAAVEVERLKMNERKGIPACSTERPSQTKVKQALRAQLNPHNRTSGHLQGRSTSSQSARRKEENPMVNSQVIEVCQMT